MTMNLQQVMTQLEEYGDERTKKTTMRHGAKEPFYGVKVGDLKKIVKKVKKDHELSLALYDTGNGDAMYLAGLIADENQITRGQLEEWVIKAPWQMISEYTVPWVASESHHGYELALEWIDSDDEPIACSGWCTLSSLATLRPDEELDISHFGKLLQRVKETIHDAQNRVRYCMNGFVIAVGSGIKDLSDEAMIIAREVGKVHVDQGGTACKVPFAPDYIKKVIDRGSVGNKRKTARC